MKPSRFLIGILLTGMIGVTLPANQSQKDKKESNAPAPINPIGQPTYKQGQNSLYALWYEDGVWHLRTTSATRTVFVGKIRVEGGRIADGALKALEPPGITKKGKIKAKDLEGAVLHADRMGFDFRFVTAGKTDGVDFRVTDSAEAV